MPLPYNFSRCFDILKSPVQLEVWDSIGENVNGRWQSVEGEHEFIDAIILQEDVEKMEILSEGRTALGGIAIICNREMFFKNNTLNTIQPKQTFVRYKGFTFELASDGWLNPNTNKYSYTLVRYEPPN